MKHTTGLCTLYIWVAIFLAACGSSEKLPIDLSAAESIQVSHFSGGLLDTEAGTITDPDGKLLLAQWLDQLTLEPRQYAPGQAPGDMDGGQVYTFDVDEGSLIFFYIINGPSNCHILFDGQWYRVANPSAPLLA